MPHPTVRGQPKSAVRKRATPCHLCSGHTPGISWRGLYELLVRVRGLMQRLDREAEFEEYLMLLRAEFKRKQNFMKLLEQME
jgi:hypothetical protein